MWKKILRARWPWLVAGVLLLAFYASTWYDVRRDPRPIGTADDITSLQKRSDLNVLFVLVDTLRSHRLGCYGYARDTSPTLDYLAGTGVRFAQHQSQSSWTKCSMASLWTARNPARTGVLRFDDVAPPEATLAAESFRDAGFLTAGIWRNGWVAPVFGFGQGFEHYEQPQAKAPPAPIRRENPNIVLEGTDDDVIDSAIEFLRVHGRERWVLYLHLMDVHQYVYDEESALFGTEYGDLYDNSVRREDRILGRMLWHLADEGYLEDTLIVLTSDHGEAFRERGYEGHAKEVYRETTEVPFVIAFPFRLEPGIVVESPTRNVDVWPTVLELLGLAPMLDVDGRSLVSTMLASARGDPVSEPGPPGISYLDRTWGRPDSSPLPMVAVADEGYRFVYAPGEVGADGGGIVLDTREQLFDRMADPRELDDVSEEYPEIADDMRAIAERYLEMPPDPWGVDTPHIELEELQLNQLRALGYDIR
jgi:arylsulfatase